MEDLRKQLKNHDKEWLVSTLSSVGDAVITTNLEGEIDFVNYEAKQILECSTKDVIGKNFQDVLKIFKYEDAEPILFFEGEKNDQFIEGGLPKGSFLKLHNGIRRNLSAHFSKLLSREGQLMGYVVVFRDITKIMETENAMNRERNNLQRLFEMLPTAMVVIDSKLSIQSVNQSFLNNFGVTEDQVLNGQFGDVLSCIWSKKGGCGFSLNCKFCEFRSTITMLISTDEMIKDLLLEMSFFKNGQPQSCWLNISLMPAHSEYEKAYIITVEDITERIYYEKSLDEARKTSLTLLDSLPVMIYRINQNYHCDFINQTFKSYMNIGKDRFFNALESNMTPEDFTKFNTALEQSIQIQSDFKIEVQLNSPYQMYRSMLGIGKPLYDENNEFVGIIGLFLDVHDAQMAERLYIQSLNKYYSLFKNMEISISYHRVEYDLNHNIVDSEIIEMNEATDFIFGLHSTDIVGTKLSEVSFLNKEEFNRIISLFQIVICEDEKVHLVEHHIESINKWVEVSIYSPEEDYIAMLISDVDYKKRSEIEMRLASEESHEANRAKSEFLANMSHEIRTPLNGIVGMIDLTMMDALNFEQKDNLLTAKECVSSLIDIINDVLEFSKLEAGKLRLEPEAFEVRALLESTVKGHYAHAQQKGLELQLVYETLIENKLVGDAKRIKQITNNFISNAIKFTNEGIVKVIVSQKNLHQADGVQLEISIVDTGIGIANEKKSFLFKSFTQVDGSYTRQYGGTGLGLVISKQFIDMMNGVIEVESVFGEGSNFTFKLPLRISHTTEYQNPEVDMIFTHYKNKHILLVEDDRVNQIVIGKMLELSGIIVDVAKNGLEAIEKNEIMKYDMILMDIQMPILDGLQATQKIRKESLRHSKTPIVALTAFALKGDEEIFRASGMDDYISKPVNRQQLMTLLSRYLDAPLTRSKTDIAYSQTESEDNELLRRVTQKSQEVTMINEEKLYELSARMQKIKSILLEENSAMLEVVAHQLKVQFEELNAEELKNLAFKMELEIRKGRLENVNVLLDRIDQVLSMLKISKN